MAVTSLGTADQVESFASVGADIDLIALSETRQPCRWIKIGVSGDLVIVDGKGRQRTLYAAGDGFVEVVAASRIIAAGSTATNINVYF